MNAHANQTLITLIQGSLVEIMMRDGAMYFGIIVLANLANVGTLYPGDHPHVWTTSLSVTRISRLIIGYTTGLTQKHHTDGRKDGINTPSWVLWRRKVTRDATGQTKPKSDSPKTIKHWKSPASKFHLEVFLYFHTRSSFL
ncbi:hypothetical protein B0H19DRAFT_1232593, partial [Mycena capillaripes]